jgi:hypothetical protein
MKITSILGAVVGLVGVFWLGIVGWYGAEWYEHRPHGEPTWATVHFLWFKWTPPDSLAAQRDFYKDRVQVLEDDQKRLLSSLQLQNTAIQVMADQGERTKAKAQAAVDQGKAQAARADALAREIAGLPPITDNTCPGLEPSDTALVAYLRTIK